MKLILGLKITKLKLNIRCFHVFFLQMTFTNKSLSRWFFSLWKFHEKCVQHVPSGQVMFCGLVFWTLKTKKNSHCHRWKPKIALGFIHVVCDKNPVGHVTKTFAGASPVRCLARSESGPKELPWRKESKMPCEVDALAFLGGRPKNKGGQNGYPKGTLKTEKPFPKKTKNHPTVVIFCWKKTSLEMVSNKNWGWWY